MDGSVIEMMYHEARDKLEEAHTSLCHINGIDIPLSALEGAPRTSCLCHLSAFDVLLVSQTKRLQVAKRPRWHHSYVMGLTP